MGSRPDEGEETITLTLLAMNNLATLYMMRGNGARPSPRSEALATRRRVARPGPPQTLCRCINLAR